MELIHPHTKADVVDALVEANARAQRVLVVGGWTHMDRGNPTEVDAELWTTMLDRLVAYEPAEMIAVVEAGMRVGDLNRIVGRQGLGQQFADAPVDAVLVGVAARPADLLAEPIPGGLLDGGEAAVRAEGGTACEHGDRGEQDRQPRAWPDHGWVPGRWGESDRLHGVLWPPCPGGMGMALGSGVSGRAGGAAGAGPGCWASRA